MGLRHQLEVIQVSYNALECEEYYYKKFVHDYTSKGYMRPRPIEQYLSAHKGHFTAILYYYDAYVM